MASPPPTAVAVCISKFRSSLTLLYEAVTREGARMFATAKITADNVRMPIVNDFLSNMNSPCFDWGLEIPNTADKALLLEDAIEVEREGWVLQGFAVKCANGEQLVAGVQNIYGAAGQALGVAGDHEIFRRLALRRADLALCRRDETEA